MKSPEPSVTMSYGRSNETIFERSPGAELQL